MELADFQDQTWEHILAACDSPMLLALSKDDELVAAAKLIEECGPKAGAAYIVSVLTAQYNPMMAIDAACFYYRQLAEKHDLDILRQKVLKMTELTAWGGRPFRCPCPTKKWPVKPAEEMLTESAGMLNFLLLEGLKRLYRDPNSEGRPVEWLVATGISEFLDWLSKVGGLRELTSKKSAKRLLEDAAC
jgi:hypothetical protein